MILDFLKTKTSKRKLKVTLAVLREFKACESNEEWLATMNVAWAKLEQFEEYLAHLVDDKLLNEDTLEQLNIQATLSGRVLCKKPNQS